MPPAPTPVPVAVAGYLRHPTIAAGTVVFLTEDDLWSVPAAGGPARRLTADLLGAGRPVLSPDARLIAFTSDAQGRADVYVMPAAGGMARRLTWLGGPPPGPGGTARPKCSVGPPTAGSFSPATPANLSEA